MYREKIALPRGDLLVDSKAGNSELKKPEKKKKIAKTKGFTLDIVDVIIAEMKAFLNNDHSAFAPSSGLLVSCI